METLTQGGQGVFSITAATKYWRRLVVLLFVLVLTTWIGIEYLMPDDCESKYHRLKVGMTEAEVSSVMERRNVLLRLVSRGERLRRASGLTSAWAEEWYESETALIGIHFQWGADGKLVDKAIWKDGMWHKSSE